MLGVRRAKFPKACGAASICIDNADAKVVNIAAGFLADDIERLTGRRPSDSTGRYPSLVG